MATNTPNLNLYKKNPTQDYNDTFNIDTMLNENWDRIDSAVGDLNTQLKTNINQQTTTLTNTNPTERIMAKQNCGVDVEVGGEMVVNYVPNGDFCQGTKFWTVWSGTQSVSDNTNTLTGDGSEANPQIGNYNINSLTPSVGTKILVQAKVKALDTVSYIHTYLYSKDSGKSAIRKIDNPVVNTKYRLGFKFAITQSFVDNWNSMGHVVASHYIDSATSNGKRVEVSECMLSIISDDEYNNLTVDQLLAKYPYTNSAQPLLNPAVEVCGVNLVQNGNCTYEIFNGARKEDTTRISSAVGKFNVKSNTDYVLSTSNAMYYNYTFYDKEGNEIITSSWSSSQVTRVVLTTTQDTCAMNLSVKIGDGINISTDNYFIQLQEGTTPTPYQPYQGGQIIFPTELAKIDTYQDKLTYKDGVAKVDREVKHVVLDGSLEWGLHVENVAYKTVKVLNMLNAISLISGSAVKYDGKIIGMVSGSGNFTTGDQLSMDSNTHVLLSIPNTDSGWGENYKPDVNEIKAYFNGWRMYYWNNSASVHELYNNQNGDGTGKSWVKRYQGIGTKAYHALNHEPVEAGSDITVLPTDKAYGIETEIYQLYYALAEPIQEEIYPIILGDGVNLVEGQNTLTVKSGVDYCNVGLCYDATNYYINLKGYNGMDSRLRYKAKSILKIFKVQNSVTTDDTTNWTISTQSNYKYGNVYALKGHDHHDIDADYYVLYEILQEDYNCQTQEVKVSYEDNIRGVLNEAVETIAKIDAMLNNGLSTNDFTDLEKTKLSGLTNMQGGGYLINGNFDVWQRGTSFSSVVNGTYTADRWRIAYDESGSTTTVTRQSFTQGQTDVPYEPTYYCRINRSVAGSGGTYFNMSQPIENVRTLAGQKVNVSFYAKASKASTLKGVFGQKFGGSPPVYTEVLNTQISTAWKKYTATSTLPSIRDKTIGDNNSLFFTIQLPSNVTLILDIAQVKLEPGDVATDFIPKTYAEELRDCQRYYEVGTAFMQDDYATTWRMQTVSLSAPKRIKDFTLDTTVVSQKNTNGNIDKELLDESHFAWGIIGSGGSGHMTMEMKWTVDAEI